MTHAAFAFFLVMATLVALLARLCFLGGYSQGYGQGYGAGIRHTWEAELRFRANSDDDDDDDGDDEKRCSLHETDN